MKRNSSAPVLLVLILSNTLSFNNCYSQVDSKRDVMKGIVVDSLTNQPLSGVTVVVTVDNKPATTITTNLNGAFEISAAVFTRIQVEFSHIGYKNYKSIASYHNAQVELKKVLLSPLAKVLTKVTVEAPKPILELKAGMSIYHVQYDPMASGKQLNEVLENLPGVSTEANGSVKVNGVSEILVMINHRTSRMNYNDLLKQMPASSVARIELIQGANPRFASSGAEYVINIVTKKETPKSGTFAASAGTNTMVNNLFTYNYGLKKVTLYTRINYSGNNMPHLREYIREDEFSSTDLFTMTGNNHTKHAMGNLIVGTHHVLDTNNQLSFEYGLNLHKDDFAAYSKYIQYDTALNLKRRFVNNVQTEPREMENNFSLNHQRKINKKSTIESELYFSLFRQRNNRTSPLAGESLQSLFHSYNINFTSELQLQKRTKLFAAGIAFRRVRIGKQWNTVTSSSSAAGTVDNNVDAAGAYVSVNINKDKNSFSASLRSELLQLRSEEAGAMKRDTAYKNFAFYPSLFYKRSLTKSATLTVAASRKVIYPEVHFVFSSPTQPDDFDLWSGNAELIPAVTNRLQTDINFKKKKTAYSLLAFIVVVDNAFGRQQSFQNNIKTEKFVNFDVRISKGLSSNINLSVVKWLSTRINASANFNQVKTSPGQWIKFNDGFNISGAMTNLITLTQKVSFENAIRFMNHNRTIYEKSTPVVNVTAQLTYRPLSNEKMVLSLFGNDLLNQMQFKGLNYLNKYVQQTSTERGKWTRWVRLNVNYRFGGTIKTREKKLTVDKVSYIQG